MLGIIYPGLSRSMNVLVLAQAGAESSSVAGRLGPILVICAAVFAYMMMWVLPWFVVGHKWAARYIERVGPDHARRVGDQIVTPAKFIAAGCGIALLVTGNTTVRGSNIYLLYAAIALATPPLMHLWGLRRLTADQNPRTGP